MRSNRIDTIDRGEDLVESDPTELTQLTQLTGGDLGEGWDPYGTPMVPPCLNTDNNGKEYGLRYHGP